MSYVLNTVFIKFLSRKGPSNFSLGFIEKTNKSIFRIKLF